MKSPVRNIKFSDYVNSIQQKMSKTNRVTVLYGYLHCAYVNASIGWYRWNTDRQLQRRVEIM